MIGIILGNRRVTIRDPVGGRPRGEIHHDRVIRGIVFSIVNAWVQICLLVHKQTETFTSQRNRTAPMADLIIKAAVRDAIDDCNVGGEFYDELDSEVQSLLDNAERRAQDNGRKTVQARDL